MNRKGVFYYTFILILNYILKVSFSTEYPKTNQFKTNSDINHKNIQ